MRGVAEGGAVALSVPATVYKSQYRLDPVSNCDMSLLESQLTIDGLRVEDSTSCAMQKSTVATSKILCRY